MDLQPTTEPQAKQDAVLAVPPADHPVWQGIVRREQDFELESLPAKMLQRTLARSVAADPSPDNLLHCAKMMQQLFAQNVSNPSIQADLEKIFRRRITTNAS